MIKVVCSSCRKSVNAPEKFAGRTVKCPGCKSPLKIPELENDDVFDDDDDLIDEEPVKKKAKKSKKSEKPEKAASKKKAAPGVKKKSGRTKISGRGKASEGSGRSKRKSGRNRREEAESGGSKKTLLIAIIGVVVLVGIGVGAYFMFFGPEDPVSPRGNGGTIAKKPKAKGTSAYIPTKVSGYGGLNLQKILSIPALKKKAREDNAQALERTKQGLKDNKEAKKILAEIEKSSGLEYISKRIKKVSVIIDTSDVKPRQAEGPPVAILIETLMDANEELALINAAVKKPLEEVDLLGYDAYLIDKRDEMYLVPVADNMVVFGNKKMLERVKKAAANDEGNVDYEDLDDAHGKNMLWLNWKSKGEEFVKYSPTRMPVNFNDVKSVLLTLNYSEKAGIDMLSEILAPNEEMPQTVAELVNKQYGPMLKNMKMTDKEFNFKADGKKMVLKVKLDNNQIMGLAQQAMMAFMMGGMGGPPPGAE